MIDLILGTSVALTLILGLILQAALNNMSARDIRLKIYPIWMIWTGTVTFISFTVAIVSCGFVIW